MVNALLLKLTLREFKKNWFQYLSMFFITLLAVTLFLGFLSNSLTLRRRADLYLNESNLADLIVQTDGFSDDDRTFLEADGAEYRVYTEGAFTLGEGGERERIKFYISDGEIDKPYITEGEAGFLIDARIAELKGYHVGDTVTAEFSFFGEQLVSLGIENAFEFEITGLMHSIEGVNIYSNSPAFILPETMKKVLADAAAAQFPFFPAETVANLVNNMYPQFENQALLQCENPAARKEQIRSYYAEHEGNSLLFVYDRDTMESVVTLDGEVSQSLNMLYVFPVIFFLVALLVIMSTVSRLILRERINIGTLKALGIKNSRIVVHYALTGAFITLLGCILGAVLGPVIVPNVMGIKYTLMFSMPVLAGIKVSYLFTAITVAFVCLCAFLIGVWASRTVIRENPAECMRPKQIVYRPRAKKREKGSATPTRVRLSFRMALRNIRINWGRSLMTVVGILGCSALLLTSFGIGDTLDASVKNDFGGLFRYDIASSYTAGQEEALFAALDKWKAEGEVEAYERVKQYYVTVQGEKSKEIPVWVFEENSEMALVPANALSRSTANELGLAAGDEIVFSVLNRTIPLTVEQTVRTTAWNGFFLTENVFGEDAFGEASVWVKTSSPAEIARRMNEVNGNGSAITMEGRIGEIENLISSTNAMKYTLMVFAILLSVVVLYNLSLLNMKERARDMATLKVLGYTNFEISLSFIAEIMLLTVVGTALGCLCGFPLLSLVMKINEISILAFAVSLYPVSYVYSVLLSVVTGAAINFFFSLSVKKIDMTASLKSVE